MIEPAFEPGSFTLQPRDPLLVEREKTHGSFAENARTWHGFIAACPMPNDMKYEQALAMTMIYLKIARALSNPGVKDHWLDIAGYAKLGAEACDA